MRVWLKDWGPKSVVFGCYMGKGLGTKDFRIDRTYGGDFPDEEVSISAAASAYFWFAVYACANEVDLEIDMPILQGDLALPSALAALWKALLKKDRLSTISFSRVTQSSLRVGKHFLVDTSKEDLQPEEVNNVLCFSGGLDSCNVLKRLLRDGLDPILMTVNNQGVTDVWAKKYRAVHFSSPHPYQLIPEELLNNAPASNVTGYTWYAGFCPLVGPPPTMYVMTRPCQYHLWYRFVREFLVPAVNPAAIHLTTLNGFKPAYLFHYTNRYDMWREVLSEHPEWRGMLGLTHQAPPKDGEYEVFVNTVALLEMAGAGIAPDFMPWKGNWRDDLKFWSEGWILWAWNDVAPDKTREMNRQILRNMRAALTSELALGSEESMEELREAIRQWRERVRPLREQKPDRWCDLEAVQIDGL